MSGGGDTPKQTTTVQNNEPNSFVSPYLAGGYKDLTDIYKQGAPGYYPGSTVADFAPETNAALTGTTARATQGTDPLNTASSSYLQDVLGGRYLGQQGPGWDAVQNAARNAATGSYARAGRYGSGAHDTAVSGAVGQLEYQNYSDRLRQMDSAAALAPQVAASTQGQDYLNLSKLGGVGETRQAQSQALINENVQRYNYEQNAPFDWASQYLALLNGAQGGQSTTKTPYYEPSPWGQIAGAGLAAGGSILGAYLGGG